MAPVKKHHSDLGRHFLAAWRQKAGLSQQKAAESLGADRSVLSKIEGYKVPYGQRLIEAAAKLYGRTPAELVGGDPKRIKGPSVDAVLMAKDVSPEDWRLMLSMAEKLPGVAPANDIQPSERKALISEAADRSPDQKSPVSKPRA